MRIIEFIDRYDGFDPKVTDMRDEFVNGLLKVTYVPYLTKVETCNLIINNSWYYNDVYTNKKKLHITSTATFVLYVLMLIKTYLDIEVDMKNYLTEYDLLNNGDYLGILMEVIPENELAEFRTILEMVKDDVLQNEYYAGAYVKDRLDNLAEAMKLTIAPAVEQLSEVMKNVDENKVADFLGKMENSNVMKMIMKVVK